MTKTMSIRMDRDNYEFLSAISREERATCRRRCGTW